MKKSVKQNFVTLTIDHVTRKETVTNEKRLHSPVHSCSLVLPSLC
jgi:hypothetical protein